MSTNTPQAVESSASKPKYIVHAVCHDCARFEELFVAANASTAKADAITAAIAHARQTGCENVEEALIDAPQYGPTVTVVVGP